MQFDTGQVGEGMRKKRRCRVCPFLLDRHGSVSELEYHLLLPQNPKLINAKDHAELSQQATELKRTLTALLQKLNADR